MQTAPPVLLAVLAVGTMFGAKAPAPGISIAQKDRAELVTGTNRLAIDIQEIRETEFARFLPDVKFFTTRFVLC